MARKAVPLRLEPAQLDRLAAIAAKLQVSKTSIIEAALDVRLDLLEGYVKLDTAPVKAKPKPLKVEGTLGPGGIAYVDGNDVAVDVIAGRVITQVRTQPKVAYLKPTDDLSKNLGQTRSMRGYAIDGSPIYR